MTTLLGEERAPQSAAPDEPAPVRLRVSRAGETIDEFDLPEGKCTIGSSPSCQVRLADGYVRPLQCLVVRTGGRFTVTRWSAGIQLNGLDFTTALLHVGDVLSVVDLSIELIATTSAADPLPSDADSPVALIDQVAAEVAAEVGSGMTPAAQNPGLAENPKSEPLNAKAETQLARLYSANQHTRQRLRRLVGALRRLRDEARGLDVHVNVLTEQLLTAHAIREQLAAELHQTQAIAEERESQFGEELDRAIAELSSSHEKARVAEANFADLQSLNEQLQQQLSSLATECEQLRNGQARDASEKTRLESELAGREVQLDQLRGELVQLHQAFEATIAELRQENETLRNELAAASVERERQVAELREGLESSIYELHEQNESLREQVTQIASERDRQCSDLQAGFQIQLAEAQGQNETLRSQVVEIASARDRQIADLQADFELQLAESRGQCEALSSQIAEVGSERDRQIADLQANFELQLAESRGQCEALSSQIAEVGSERDRQIADLRAAYESQLRDALGQNETLRNQAAEIVGERDRQTAELESLGSTIKELRDEIDSLNNKLSEVAAEREREVAALRQELAEVPLELEAELGTIRRERQQLAEEKHRLSDQLQDAEKRIQLLEIDVRSANSEWQQAQNTVTRLQDELFSAEARAADLDAKLADFLCSAEVERAVECDHFAGDLAAARQQLSERGAALAAATAERERLSEQLTATQTELAQCAALLSQLSQEIEDLKGATSDAEGEQSRLVSEIADRDSRIELLTGEVRRLEANAATESQRAESRLGELTIELEDLRNQLAAASSASDQRIAELVDNLEQTKEQLKSEVAAKEAQVKELSERDSRIAILLQELEKHSAHALAESQEKEARVLQLANELEEARKQIAEKSAASDQQVAELVDRWQRTETQLKSELAAKEALVATASVELNSLQDQITGEATSRDIRIAELTQALQQGEAEFSARLQEQQSRVGQLTAELSDAAERSSVELRAREDRIAELARELRDTQDRLADCAAQGERLNELYQQAQADLVAFAALSNEQVETDGSSEVLSPRTQVTTKVDPRDDDDPRIIRALASLAAEQEAKEAEQLPQEFQPTSFIDQYNHIFDEDSSQLAESALPVASNESRKSPELLEIAGDDSDALEAYMANMMKRVRGETSSDDIAPPIAHEPAREFSPSFSNPVARMDTLTRRVSAPVEPEPKIEENLIDLQQLKETSQKPPLPTNLSAMRELANISARQAIAKHRKRRHFEGALSKLLVSGIAGCTAAYMLFTADDYLSPYFLAGCGVAVVSGYWGFKLLGISLEIIRDGINDEPAPMDISELEAPLPIDGPSE